MDELNEVIGETEPTSLLQIWHFARQERKTFVAGIVATFIRGLAQSTFSIAYGRLFKALSTTFDSSTRPDNFNQLNLTIALSFAGEHAVHETMTWREYCRHRRLPRSINVSEQFEPRRCGRTNDPAIASCRLQEPPQARRRLLRRRASLNRQADRATS